MPTENLKRDHRIIEKTLAALTGICRRLEEGNKVPPQALTDAAEFISEFADRLHHGKEEKHLFPALVERGIPIDGGPVGVMLYEHETGRTLVAALGSAAQAYKNDEAGAADIFVRAARSYIELLSFHIHKEDNILFNMARHVLDDSTRQSLLTAFEGEEAAFAERDKYERLAEALAAEWAS